MNQLNPQVTTELNVPLTQTHVTYVCEPQRFAKVTAPIKFTKTRLVAGKFETNTFKIFATNTAQSCTMHSQRMGQKNLKEPERPELAVKLKNTQTMSSELFSSCSYEIPIFSSKEKQAQNAYLCLILMSINLDYFPEINILYFSSGSSTSLFNSDISAFDEQMAI